MSKLNEALQGEKEYRTAVESAAEYIENFDILETITNVGNDEVFTPRKTVEAILDILPEEVWHNPNYKWLNPATKNGVFEREIAIRLDKGLADIIPDTETRRKHILQKMIFSLGQTKFTSNVARRTVYYCSQANRKCDGVKAPDGHYVNGYAIGNGTWFDNEEGNIKTPCTDHVFVDNRGRAMPDDCSDDDRKKYSCKYCGTSGASKYNDANQREKYAYEFIHIDPSNIEQYLQNRFFKGDRNMKFDIIIGNPPYQLDDGGAQSSATPIYHLFVEQAKKLNPKYLSMIIPSRWYSGGKGLEEFRDEMLHDKHICKIVDYPVSKECFPAVEIKGGVCFFLRNREITEKCEVVNIRGKSASSMKRELLEKNANTFIRFNEAISIYNKVIAYSEDSFSDLISARKPFGLSTEVKGKNNAFDNSVVLYGKKNIAYIERSKINQNAGWIDKYKILISYAYGAGEDFPHQIINVPFIAEKNSACTETYLVIGPFDEISTANNVLSYLKTKFLRFLVLLIKNTQHATKTVYQFVPTQDFTKPWSDKELYEKYNLNNEEIAYIESMIKPMD